ncbi:urease accessory protein UreD [Clostridium sp. 1001271B_151109_B4]|uniref:urease accessory protein UreD n=1 Tax=Clostridium sp. 1001271B_151109_B4 TaxID=2787148 RepID=UPI0018AA66E5|nr:urease accessory protein UreD [Clostridium sp. 1001271B_151109_B4]
MFKEAKEKSKYSGFIDLVLDKKDDKTIATKKYYEGLVKVSPTIKMDRENIPTYYLLQLGGGYIEGEKYKNVFRLKDNTRAIITTQASAKVYKCLNGIKTEQETEIGLGKNSILEYITDSVILYKDAIYKQVNNIYLDKSSTLIYSDGITAGWSPDGDKFTYKSVQLKSNVYVNNKLVLLDNLFVNPSENDVTKLGFFEDYSNFGTLLVINENINEFVISDLRGIIEKLNLPIDFGISRLEVNGFVLRVLGNLTQHIETAIGACHNYVRRKFLGSNNLVIRKY